MRVLQKSKCELIFGYAKRGGTVSWMLQGEVAVVSGLVGAEDIADTAFGFAELVCFDVVFFSLSSDNMAIKVRYTGDQKLLLAGALYINQTIQERHIAQH